VHDVPRIHLFAHRNGRRRRFQIVLDLMDDVIRHWDVPDIAGKSVFVEVRLIRRRCRPPKKTLNWRALTWTIFIGCDER
jgi:hypothetical protein